MKLVRLQKAVFNISSNLHLPYCLSRWLTIVRYALRNIGIEALAEWTALKLRAKQANIDRQAKEAAPSRQESRVRDGRKRSRSLSPTELALRGE